MMRLQLISFLLPGCSFLLLLLFRAQLNCFLDIAQGFVNRFAVAAAALKLLIPSALYRTQPARYRCYLIFFVQIRCVGKIVVFQLAPNLARHFFLHRCTNKEG